VSSVSFNPSIHSIISCLTNNDECGIPLDQGSADRCPRFRPSFSHNPRCSATFRFLQSPCAQVVPLFSIAAHSLPLLPLFFDSCPLFSILPHSSTKTPGWHTCVTFRLNGLSSSQPVAKGFNGLGCDSLPLHYLIYVPYFVPPFCVSTLESTLPKVIKTKQLTSLE